MTVLQSVLQRTMGFFVLDTLILSICSWFLSFASCTSCENFHGANSSVCLILYPWTCNICTMTAQGGWIEVWFSNVSTGCWNDFLLNICCNLMEQHPLGCIILQWSQYLTCLRDFLSPRAIFFIYMAVISWQKLVSDGCLNIPYPFSGDMVDCLFLLLSSRSCSRRSSSGEGDVRSSRFRYSSSRRTGRSYSAGWRGAMHMKVCHQDIDVTSEFLNTVSCFWITSKISSTDILFLPMAFCCNILFTLHTWQLKNQLKRRGHFQDCFFKPGITVSVQVWLRNFKFAIILQVAEWPKQLELYVTNP